MEQATCSTCKNAYGNLGDHNWGDWTYSEDGKHTRTCTLNNEHTDSGNCDHEAATCLAASACSVCGHVYEAKKDHSYTYTASGSTITETCLNGCDHNETAKLEYATGNGTYTYTGSEIKPLKVTTSSGWQGGELAISYSGSTTNVGDAMGVITATAQTDVKASLTYKITEADISEADVIVRPSLVTYGQTAEAGSAEISVKWNGATLTIDKDYKVEWDKTPYNSGVGTYTATITGIGNFTGTTSGSTVVESARLTNVSVSQTGTLIYDGESKTPTVTTTATTVDGSQVTFAYSKVIEDVYGEMPSFTGAGTYTVYYKASAPNHEDYKGSFTVTIAPTDGSATVSIEGWEYGDTAKTPVPVSTTNGTDNVTYQYKVKGADDNTYTSTVPTAVGEYTVKATFGATQNHKEVTATADFAISKRTVTVTADNAGKTYGSAEPELTWKVTSGTELVNEKLVINISRAEGEDAGDYTITVSQTEDANPNYDITFESGTFTIGKAELTVTAENTTATYGDAVPAYTVTYSGFVNGDDKGDLGGTLAFDCDYVQFADKGEYTITPKGYESNNYEISYESGKLTVSAKALDGSAVSVPVMSLPYTGEAQTLSIVVPEGVTYDLIGGSLTETNVGMYEFTIQFTGNHTGMATKGWQITAVAPSATAPTANTLTYNGEDQTLIAAGSTEDGTMVYSLEKEGTYTTELPKAMTAGTYNVWYKVIGDSNHTNSDPASIEVEIDKADPSIGKVTAGVVNDTLETSAIVLTRENPTVDGMLTVDAGQTLALGENTINYTFTPKDTTNYKVVTGEVTVTVKDTIAPTGTVTISTNSWNQFLNDITFGMFFKETQTVSVSASDNLSGVAKIEYIESKTAMDLDAVKAAEQWTEMKNGSVSVTLEDTKQFIYYIRITDNSGNVSYLSSDGAVYDTTDPVIDGVSDGATYYTTQTVTVTDNIATDTITLNGKAATGSITLEGNKEATYIIVATDKAGHSATVTVKMAPISDITDSMEGKTDANVTSDDKANLQTIVDTATELLQDEDTTPEEKAALEDAKAEAEALLDAIEDAAKAANTENTAKVEDVTADNVTPEDKSELEDAKADLEKALEDNGGNYTEDEKKAIQEEIARMDEALQIIENVEAVEDTISDLPAAVEPDDEKAVAKLEEAKKAYGELTEYEKSLVEEATRKKLESLNAAAVAYKLVKGDGSSWTKGGTSGLSFTANGPLGKFSGVEIDGKVIDAKYYDAVAGSTVIALKVSYLETLAVGEHTITVGYTDGKAEGAFKIIARSVTPATGDDSNLVVCFGLLCVSALGLAVLLADRKRRTQYK